jgi:hypothetical protein
MAWDEIGLKARAPDWAAWPGTTGDDRMYQSQFTLFRDIGRHLLGPHSREGIQFALNRIALAGPRASVPTGSTVDLKVGGGDRPDEEKHQPLAFLATPCLGNAKKVFVFAVFGLSLLARNEYNERERR